MISWELQFLTKLREIIVKTRCKIVFILDGETWFILDGETDQIFENDLWRRPISEIGLLAILG